MMSFDNNETPIDSCPLWDIYGLIMDVKYKVVESALYMDERLVMTYNSVWTV